MSKITRKKLTRGVTLGTEHVHASLDAIANTVTSAEQVKVKWSPFRVNFNFPVLNRPASTINPLSIPFVLPPLQGNFWDVSVASRDVPQIILDEVSFSFDSRSEKGAIRGTGWIPETDAADKCAVNISILEKRTTVDQFQFEAEVVSMQITGVQLVASATERFNPCYLDNINRVLDPYKTYILRIDAPDLEPTLVMPNVNVSLRLRARLDTPTAALQNAPAMSGSPVVTAIVTPGAGAPIAATAPSGGGVQEEMDKVDEIFLDRLKGGMDKDGTPDDIYHLAADAGYEVIAVPLYQSPIPARGDELLAGTAGLPYYALYSGISSLDRRIIPIHYPVIIHHVFAVANYSDLISNKPPTTLGSTFTHHVGVGIGRGIRSDAFTYQQVAQAQWSPNDPTFVNRIDKCGEWPTYLNTNSFEIIAVPLEGSGGKGYPATQGGPIYAGRMQQIRSDIDGGTPNTGGMEQFIEVRWVMQNSNPVATTLGTASDDIFAGAGGHWVYLICEKRLAGRRS